VRDAAGVRDTVTIYSFQHFWISEMLRTGADSLRIARMAGTSLTMIERVYGHFAVESFQQALAKLDAWRAKQGACS